jgi:hypothetical protein
MGAVLATVAAYAPSDAQFLRPLDIGVSGLTPGDAVLAGGLVVYALALFSTLGPRRT